MSIAIASVFVAQPRAQAGIELDFSSLTGGFSDGIPRVIGWEFTTGSQPISVNRFGVLDFVATLSAVLSPIRRPGPLSLVVSSYNSQQAELAMKITIETEVAASPKQVWDAWVTPDHITKWNVAIDEWCCPRAEVDLRVGGGFKYRMEARDGSVGFDFEGVFTKVSPQESLHFELGDDRLVTVEFMRTTNGTRVTETFEAEDENSAEQQQQGWRSILDNFKKYVEIQNG